MKSRVASKRHADTIRKRNHCLQVCSRVLSLCSGPNTRYRLPLDKIWACKKSRKSNLRLNQNSKVTGENVCRFHWIEWPTKQRNSWEVARGKGKLHVPPNITEFYGKCDDILPEEDDERRNYQCKGRNPQWSLKTKGKLTSWPLSKG